MDSQQGTLPADVMRFIDDRIESIPHLEAVLLLWEHEDLRWDVDLVASRLYIGRDKAASILEDLAARQLIVRCQNAGHAYYRYDNEWDSENRGTMRRVAAIYRHQLLHVTALIHSKAPTAVRDFARAFHIPMKK